VTGPKLNSTARNSIGLTSSSLPKIQRFSNTFAKPRIMR
jgi:hypothetical protein